MAPFLRTNISDKRRPPDKETAKERKSFERVRRAEIRYGSKLRAVAQQVGDIVKAYRDRLDEFGAVTRLESALRKYADLITPWAEVTAAGMIADVSRRERSVWVEQTQEMGRAMRREIMNAPTGQVVQQRLNENVKLIRSIPLKAGERVHKLTLEALSTSRRASDIADEIMRTTHVTKSRATLIARTETARTQSALTEARARHVGSTHYVWRTADDSDVRPSHKKVNGKVFAWDNPPTLDGMTGGPGETPNCRCFAEPLIPDKIE